MMVVAEAKDANKSKKLFDKFTLSPVDQWQLTKPESQLYWPITAECHINGGGAGAGGEKWNNFLISYISDS